MPPCLKVSWSCAFSDPCSGISRVQKLNKTKFWTQCVTWWSIYASNQTFFLLFIVIGSLLVQSCIVDSYTSQCSDQALFLFGNWFFVRHQNLLKCQKGIYSATNHAYIEVLLLDSRSYRGYRNKSKRIRWTQTDKGGDHVNQVRGHPKTTLTKNRTILTTYLPTVDMSWH